jgi:ferredoxin--NADP+ reductase
MGEEAHTVVIIGAGPAGIYAARKLQRSGCEVVILNRDVRPGGLAEYGIFHDKYKMKAGLRKQFTKILDTEGIHYRGNIVLGQDGNLSVDELDDLGFDAVLLAVGAQGIKWLQIEGSEAGHIYDAKQVVYHYNGLPPYSQQSVHLGEHLVIIGAGNVAVDITHWAVQENVPRITWLVRRGPNQVKYTKKEIGYVGAHVDRESLRSELNRIAGQLEAVGERVDETWTTIETPMGHDRIEGSSTVISMRFACQASAVHKDEDGNISALQVVENELYPRGEGVGCRPTGESLRIETDTLVFCVGDAVDPSVGLELDQWGSYAIEEEEGETGYQLKGRSGWFAAGWARVASDGLVGKARKDAEVACDHVSTWLEGRPPKSRTPLAALDALLSERGVQTVEWKAFQKTRAREEARAEAEGLDDFRFVSNEAMIEAAEL